MPQTPSPLRYPGGKTSIFKMVSAIIEDNGLERGHYAEPYAGGAGLALSLLFKGCVHELHLNDLDRSIWSIWHTIINDSSNFIEKIEETPITMEEWHKQRAIQEDKHISSTFDLAFSSFFLNRTNRSGIILKAGVIGGLKQSGSYKLDCRFNKKSLVEKIKRIAKFSHRIHIYNDDAIDFLEKTNNNLPSSSFYCIDPPYFVKGSSLYTNAYEEGDHRNVALAIERLTHPWILTYDNVPQIQDLYPNNRQFRFNLNYSAAQKRIGTELLVVSNGMQIPKTLNLFTV